ncbi:MULTISPECIES: hypothetical protein [Hyphomonas]|nr:MULTISPECIES: hypothetical protein [Hyphomonas]|tara:strand:- start:177 stop:560 length:384 start_codon:yes stop_codon:yes gene_type:complete
MKITELIGKINTLEISTADAEALEKALKRFGAMSILEFSAFLKKQKLPSAAKDYVSLTRKLKELKAEPSKFDAELNALARKVTKQDLQAIFKELFETRSTLPAKLTKPEMLERIKRQRRRDANFASA